METILYSLTTKVKNHDFSCFSQAWSPAGNCYLELCTGLLLAGSWEGPQGSGLHCWLELTDDPSGGGIRGYSCDRLWDHATAMIFPDLKHPVVFGIFLSRCLC